jgi:hypothetical protein
MNKKIYTTPTTRIIVLCGNAWLMTTSGEGKIVIPVDPDNPPADPSTAESRRRKSIWDDDEEEW